MATATATSGRRIARGVVIVAALMLALALVALNFGAHAARTRAPALIGPTAALSPAAAAIAAEAALGAGHPVQAEALARRALARDPMSAMALRVLGLSQERQGRGDDGAQAMALAGGLGWRDTPTQAWLIDAFARQGDFDAALERADALARRRQMPAEMRAVFLVAAITPETRVPLAERLAANPSWRGDFFDGAELLAPEQFDAFAEFLRLYAADHGALAPTEVEPFARRLFTQGEPQRARAVWMRHAAANLRADGNEILDGGFEAAALATDSRPSPFEWRFRQAPGSETRLESAPGSEDGQALYAASSGQLRFEIAAQGLALAPGRYRLSLDAMPDAASLSPSLDCGASGRAEVGAARAAPTVSGWTPVSYNIVIPAGGCAAQTLKLWLRGYQSRPAQLWIDNVALRRAE